MLLLKVLAPYDCVLLVLQVVFKTLPGPRISRVELGGTPGAVMDKVFFAAGTEVQGYQKKGKSFLRFDTNLSEDIQSMLGCGDCMTLPV